MIFHVGDVNLDFSSIYLPDVVLPCVSGDIQAFYNDLWLFYVFSYRFLTTSLSNCSIKVFWGLIHNHPSLNRRTLNWTNGMRLIALLFLRRLRQRKLSMI